MNTEDVLTEERIAAMRTTVMSEVRATTARRSFWWGAAVSAAAFLVIGSIGSVAISGLLSTGSSDSTEIAVDEADGGFVASPTSGRDGGGAVADAESAPDVALAEGDTSSEETTEHLIITGSISVEVDKTTIALEDVRTEVARLGGRIDHESQGRDDTDHAMMTVRIPGAQVEAFQDYLAEVGTVTDVWINRSEVGQQVRDLQARIAALEVSTARLRAIMEDASNTRDLLEAEARLAERQAELESYLAQQKALTDQTAMATIEVFMTPKSATTAVDAGGFRGGLVSGWNAIISVVNVVVTAAGFLIPWLLPLAVVAFFIRWLVRRRRRSGAATG